MPIRLAIVISHPIQHFAPMFRDLARTPGLELKVFYCCEWGVKPYRDPGFGRQIEWDIPLLEGYAYEFLPIARPPKTLTYRDVDNPDVGRRLEAFQPQVVWIHGYGHRTSWRVWRWARGRAKTLFFGDSELLHQRRLASRLIKRIVLPRFYRRIDAFITIGDNNEAYYRHYDVPDRKMFRGAFPVDIRRFRSVVESLTPEMREETRLAFGLSPDAFVVLFVGKFIPIKRPLDLIDAVAQLKAQGIRVQALFIGAGELENAMRTRIKALGAEDAIRIAGFVNQAEMPRMLAVGDALAMCSDKDPHPLAVTEAMACGLPIVASDRIGCVGRTDAARPGENAQVYAVGDVAALADTLRYLACDSALRRRMSAASVELCWTQDTQVTVGAVLRAIESFQLVEPAAVR